MLTDEQIEALVVWEGDPKDPHYSRIEHARAIEAEVRKEIEAEEAEEAKVASIWPAITFEEAVPGLEVGYDMCGGVDIRLAGEFVYVHINYDYRYTSNAARQVLADDIVKLLTLGWPKDASKEIESAVLAEREACAQLFDEREDYLGEHEKAIRARTK